MASLGEERLIHSTVYDYTVHTVILCFLKLIGFDHNLFFRLDHWRGSILKRQDS